MLPNRCCRSLGAERLENRLVLASGVVPISGDWNGNGIDSVGFYDPRQGSFLLLADDEAGAGETEFQFGPRNSQMSPMIGDWNGDGTDTPGLYSAASGRFFLINSTQAGVADIVFTFGPTDKNWTPIAGDWNGDGFDGVGLFEQSTSKFFLRDETSTGRADYRFKFGPDDGGWNAIAGDWNGDGVDGVGLRADNGEFYLKERAAQSPADHQLDFGSERLNWTPIAGDWDGDGTSDLGIARGDREEFELFATSIPLGDDMVTTDSPYLTTLLDLSMSRDPVETETINLSFDPLVMTSDQLNDLLRRAVPLAPPEAVEFQAEATNDSSNVGALSVSDGVEAEMDSGPTGAIAAANSGSQTDITESQRAVPSVDVEAGSGAVPLDENPEDEILAEESPAREPAPPEDDVTGNEIMVPAEDVQDAESERETDREIPPTSGGLPQVNDQSPATTNDDLATEDTATEDTATEDTATEDTATEDTATEDTATEDTATEDTATEDTATEDTATEETPSIAAVVDQIVSTDSFVQVSDGLPAVPELELDAIALQILLEQAVRMS